MDYDKSMQELCAERGVDFSDFLAVCLLYKSDRDEEEILVELEQYPEAARELATFLLLGI